MVGWHLLLLLVVEVVAYGAVGRYMHVARGWSIGAAVALAVGIYVAVRMVLVGAEFIIARIKGSPIPPALRVSIPGLAVMYIRELLGWLLMFALVMPWLRARRSVLEGDVDGDGERATPSPSSYPPILLVHGLACNRGNWFWFKRQLRDRGYRVYTMDCTPPVSRISHYGTQVHDAVEEILGATGAAQLVLIGHSQGGLSIRAYLHLYGDAKVAKVITLGTPHLGTFLAHLAIGQNTVDMRLKSAWLAELAGHETAVPETAYRKFSCIFTYHDNLVAPQLNAVLPGSKAIALSGIGHLSLALSPVVVEHVLRELDAMGHRGS